MYGRCFIIMYLSRAAVSWKHDYFKMQGSRAGLEGDMKGGAQFYAEPFDLSTHLTFQYQVYFSENFDFVKGGKLPGEFYSFVIFKSYHIFLIIVLNLRLYSTLL